MIRPVSKKNSSFLTAAILTAAVSMMAALSCQDSKVVMKEILDGQLVAGGIEGAWVMVCGTSVSGGNCDPKSVRAVSFNADMTAAIFDVTGRQWKQAAKVRWETKGGALYISYGGGESSDRYTFSFADGVLTLRDESSYSSPRLLTRGSVIAGYQRAAVPSYPVILQGDMTGGSVTVVTPNLKPVEDSSSVAPGTELMITAAPTDPNNYELASLTVNGQIFANGATLSVSDTVKIAAVFAPRTYLVTYTKTAGGELTVARTNGVKVDSGTVVPVNTVLMITATPTLPNYVMHTLTLNGSYFISGTTHTVDRAVTVVATFRDTTLASYPVTFPVGLISGSISVVDTLTNSPITNGQPVPIGTSIRITATASPGYTVPPLTVNGLPFTNGNTHIVAGPVLIRLNANTSSGGGSSDPNTFQPVNYSTSFSASAGGSVSVLRKSDSKSIANREEVAHGTDVTITAAPSPGHATSSLMVNGQPFESGGTHTVEGPLQVNAMFHSTGTGGGGGGGVETRKVAYSASAGGSVSVLTAAGIPVNNDGDVPLNTQLKITASPSYNYTLSALKVNGVTVMSNTTQPYTHTHTVTAVGVHVEAEFYGTPIEDASKPITNDIVVGGRLTPAEVADLPQAQQERYTLYEKLLNEGKESGIAFGGTWLIVEEGTIIEDEAGNLYASSGVFAPNSQFWQVAIPLQPGCYNHNEWCHDYSKPARYVGVGTYQYVGNIATINVTAAGLSGKGEKSYTGFIDTRTDYTGKEHMTIDYKGKVHPFVELNGMVFVADPNMAKAILDSGLLDD